MIIKSINDFLDYNNTKEEIKTIRVPGMAMNPEIMSGDLVVFQKVTNLSKITDGEIYLIETNAEYNSLKIIREVYFHPQNDKLILHALNPDFDGDLIIEKSSILYSYKAIGVYRDRWI